MGINARSSLEPTNDDVSFRANATKEQLRSFKAILDSRNTDEVDQMISSRAKKKLSAEQSNLCASWSNNAINTMHVIRLNKELFLDDANFYGLQWVFPQVYYAIFCSFQAMSAASGRERNDTHTGVLNEIGNSMMNGLYPSHLEIYGTGGKERMKYSSVVSADFLHARTALKTTRERLLDDKKRHLQGCKQSKLAEAFKTKKGTIRKSFTPEHWERLGSEMGPTTLIHYLYRKRVMSNYSGAYVFDYQGGGSFELYENLAGIAEEYVSWHLAVASAHLGRDLGEKKKKPRSPAVAKEGVPER